MFPLQDDVRPEDIPDAPRGARPAVKYPLAEMSIGQSFFVPIPSGKTPDQARAPVQAAVSRFYKKHPNHKFTIRLDTANSGLRVFRLKDRADDC